jgi:hypothetical protein
MAMTVAVALSSFELRARHVGVDGLEARLVGESVWCRFGVGLVVEAAEALMSLMS